MGVPRKQINTKMSESLIEAIKNKAGADGVTFTDLVNRACEELLGIETTRDVTSISSDEIDKIVAEKLAPIEERLSNLEKKIMRVLRTIER